MEMNFGELVQELRLRRGLTQADLASLSGTTSPTIWKLEKQYQGKQPRRRTIIAIYEALARSRPLTQAESREYMKLSGLQHLVNVGKEIETAAASQVSQQNPDERRVWSLVQDMVDRLGSATVIAFLEAGFRLADMSIDHADEPRSTRVVHVGPPKQKDGYVEHIEVEYDAPNDVKKTFKQRKAE